MGQPSEEASNALIYCTFAAFLVCGLAISWKLRGQSKGQWLSANRTQKGIEDLHIAPTSPHHPRTSLADDYTTRLAPCAELHSDG